MEEIRLVNDVIVELLNNGYSENFGLMEYICSLTSVNNRPARISGSDFIIDKIYCCLENENDPDIIYVFAVSSTKYEIKGITTSISLVHSSFSISEFFEKLKKGIRKIIGQ